jgi:hypothetical protein
MSCPAVIWRAALCGFHRCKNDPCVGKDVAPPDLECSLDLFICVLSCTRLVLCAAVISSNATLQGQRAEVPLAEGARGAEQVVVGRVSSVTPVWRDNDFGDRLITSIVRVAVDETLKGPSRPSVEIEIEGGTIDGLTLRVSDLDTFAPGDRAVFYLSPNRRGASRFCFPLPAFPLRRA